MSVRTASGIVESHRKGEVTPAETVRRCFEHIRAVGDPGIFITLRDQNEVLAEAHSLKDNGDLYGVPVAVKDNIDVAGLPTTAACPAFAYEAEEDAEAVTRLKRAGAIIIGKTNLDQFATGLVGLRTPYPAPRNALRRDLIPGGSSSGSAVAVAAGIVPLALGTDTAGSGRVPAMLNNIVGLKPSLGLVSTRGVVPACRTLDCVSVFTLTVDDAWTALSVIAAYDSNDPYSRNRELGSLGEAPTGLTVGVPLASQRLFFDDRRAAGDYEAALARLSHLGLALTKIDRIVVSFGQCADHGLADRKIPRRGNRHDPLLRVPEYVQFAEGRNVVDPGIGPGIGEHHQAFPDQNATAIGHRFGHPSCAACI